VIVDENKSDATPQTAAETSAASNEEASISPTTPKK